MARIQVVLILVLLARTLVLVPIQVRTLVAPTQGNTLVVPIQVPTPAVPIPLVMQGQEHILHSLQPTALSTATEVILALVSGYLRLPSPMACIIIIGLGPTAVPTTAHDTDLARSNVHDL